MLLRLLNILVVCYLLFTDGFSSVNDVVYAQKTPHIQISEATYNHPVYSINVSAPQKPDTYYFTSDDSGSLFGFERPYQQPAVRFMHPKQHAEFILVFELASDTFIKEQRLRPDKLKQPWYQCNSRPARGFIDACKPANLVYKARLTYHA